MSRILIIIVALTGLLATATTAAAQAEDLRVDGSASASEIAAFVNPRVEALSLPDIAQREAARDDLIRVATKFGTTETFLANYTTALNNAGLNDIIDGPGANDAHAAANALQVFSVVRSRAALNTVAPMINDPRMHIRLRAAAATGQLLATVPGVPDRTKMQQVNRLAQAAQTETNPLVLRRLLEAMLAVDLPDARTEFAKTLGSTVDRLQQQRPQDLAMVVDNLDIVVRRLFNNYLSSSTIGSKEKESLGADLAPALGKFFDLALAEWDTAQANPSAKAIYGRTLGHTEAFLQQIDTIARRGADRPRTNPESIWNRGSRTEFETHRDSWQGILTSPPYK